MPQHVAWRLQCLPMADHFHPCTASVQEWNSRGRAVRARCTHVPGPPPTATATQHPRRWCLTSCKLAAALWAAHLAIPHLICPSVLALPPAATCAVAHLALAPKCTMVRGNCKEGMRLRCRLRQPEHCGIRVGTAAAALPARCRCAAEGRAPSPASRLLQPDAVGCMHEHQKH